MKNERPEFKQPISKCYKNLIERCWSQEPENRPTFDEIVEELETDTDFITENSIDAMEYFKYIEYVKNPESVSYGSDDDNFELEKDQDKFKFDFPPIDLTKFEKIKNKIGSMMLKF